MIDLQELLFSRGLPKDVRTKLIRHQDTRYDLEKLVAVGDFEVYQEHQAKPVINCDYIVSFLGQSSSQARLIGIYAVRSRDESEMHAVPEGFLYPEMQLGRYRYRLEKVKGFEDLESRVVIDWGASTRAWHQWLCAKEVVEILPAGYVREFPGYDDFILSFGELRQIIQNPTANREWHRMLGAVAGIYLITDGTSGKQYVGSAYGELGVLGRWNTYAGTGHGNNAMLVELLRGDPNHANHFSFTLLRTLPRSLTFEEVLKYETLYKRKLGSRVSGLNAN